MSELYLMTTIIDRKQTKRFVSFYQQCGVTVNLNTAGAEELMTLPGIGEQRAADILAYRQANGPFRMVEELTDVPGIGEGILAGLIDYVTVE